MWNDYLSKSTGSRADFVVSNPFIGGSNSHAIDDKNRLWTVDQNHIMVWQLPLTPSSQPLAYDIKLYWADDSTEISYGLGGHGVAFDSTTKKIWIPDQNSHRILRISNYDNFQTKLYVDMVIGQPDKEHTGCNSGLGQDLPNSPTASSLCTPYIIQFDNYGNMFVIDNAYECHHNERILMFTADDLKAATGLFPDISAKKWFVNSFNSNGCYRNTLDEPTSPVNLAFNSRNQMLVGNDGYYGDATLRAYRQLWLYNDPLKKNPDGTYVQGQKPDSVVNIPLGGPGELTFDQYGNLLIQDHSWSRAWLINLDRDPSWLLAT